MAARDLVRWGDERVRLGPWRRDEPLAYLAPLPGTPSPCADSIRRSVALAAERGFDGVVTAALAPGERTAFLEAGFSVHEELHLLSHDLHGLEPVGPVPLRRGRRRDRAAAVEVDRRAFDEFWHFDELGLLDALAATPSSRFRVVDGEGGRLVGYAICGRAGQVGYVQRVAVDPDAQRRGYGLALVLDGLHWARRRGCVRAVVNTQLGNEKALALYERIGFTREPERLAVLRIATSR